MNILRSPKAVWAMLAVILLIAVYLRIDFLTSVKHNVSHDSVYYDEMVKRLIEKGVYAYKAETPNAQVAPGFPLFMAGIYKLVDYTHHDPFPYLRYANLLLSMVNLVLIYFIACKLVNARIGLIATGAAATNPPFIWANGAILTEVLATFLFLSYIYRQLRAIQTGRGRDSLIAGALLGCTALVRPEFLPVVVPIYLFYWLWTKNRAAWKLLLLACIGLSIVMSPWWIRNLVTLNKVVLTATQTNPFHAGTYPYKNWDDGLVDRHGKTQQEVAIERLKIGFTEHTWLFLKWYTVGKLDYIYSRMYFGSGHTPMYKVIPLRNQYHTAMIWTGVLGLILTLRRWRQPLTLIALILVVMSFIRLLFIPEYRYNFIAMPLFIIIGSAAAEMIARWIYARISPSFTKEVKEV
ncbi:MULTISPECIES: ArnT family glycosyltransferase [Paenibacillus]|uniref:Glycosyltransferase RgtA/B/C/D-like domain-containing protein n=1 Tax=Paenibacillus albilobatus TaxID=2716884 RepID=A0A919XKY7_9BACL|nr:MULTISPECIES: glycosyltransferase family 39 protein [Paenibacillus]GIO34907.1 hypothetical protein J2TS6_60480 [Paenibacillus albilobatus]